MLYGIKRESRHQETAAIIAECRQNNYPIYTTDYVLDETFTLLFKRLNSVQARQSLELLDVIIAAGYVQLIWITPERFAQTKELRLKFADKPNISFTDLSSMAVMKELGLTYILTGDAHFTHVGMGFVLRP